MAKENKKTPTPEQEDGKKNPGQQVPPKEGTKQPMPQENPGAGAGDKTDGKSPLDIEGVLFPLVASPGVGPKLGAPMTVTRGINEEAHASVENSMRVAGVATVTWFGTYGVGQVRADAMNQAAQALYKQVQNALRKTNLPFQAVDLLKQLIAMDNIFIMFDYVKRAFKAVYSTNALNLYTPQTLLEAMGLDYNSFQANEANIRFKLTKWAALLKKWPVPNVFNMFSIHHHITSLCFADDVSAKAQKYVFAPAYVWSWETEDTGYFLKAVPLCDTVNARRTWADVQLIMDDMLNAIQDSTDFSTINSALMSTYEEANAFTVDVSDIDSPLEFKVDMNALTALHNSLILKVENISSFRIQDPGNNILKAGGKVTLPSAGVVDWGVVDGLRDLSTATDMVHLTRWRPQLGAPTADSDASTGYSASVNSMGSEVLCGFYIRPLRDAENTVLPWYTGKSVAGVVSEGLSGPIDVTGVTYVSGDVTSDTGALQTLYDLFKKQLVLRAFRWHPMFRVDIFDNEGNPEALPHVISAPLSEWYFPVEYQPGDVARCHEALLWHGLVEDL